jgi:DNA-binding beta-propeller fold protein YncE
LFVNIEDKNEIAEVNLKTLSVENRWSLDGGEGPTGLEYDPETKRLFAACEKQLIVLHAVSGKVIEKLPIGEGCDGVAFDKKNKIIFTSNGEGTITVIKENNADSFTVLGNYPTKRGARTIAIDETTGTLYLPTADFEPNATVGTRPKMIAGTFQVLEIK